jgi:hypothetical protein
MLAGDGGAAATRTCFQERCLLARIGAWVGSTRPVAVMTMTVPDVVTRLSQGVLVMVWLWDVVGSYPLPAKVALVMMVWIPRGWCTCIVCLDLGWCLWVAATSGGCTVPAGLPMHPMLVCYTHCVHVGAHRHSVCRGFPVSPQKLAQDVTWGLTALQALAHSRSICQPADASRQTVCWLVVLQSCGQVPGLSSTTTRGCL